LKTAARIRDVPEKAECIEEVRLAASVGTDNEHPLAQGNVDAEEVSPVLKKEPGETHRLRPPLNLSLGLDPLPREDDVSRVARCSNGSRRLAARSEKVSYLPDRFSNSVEKR
jgi:hypothetical protein